MVPFTRARPIVAWVLIVLSVVMGVFAFVDSIVDPSGEQMGWGESVIGLIFVMGPMLAVGMYLRRVDRHRARVLAVVSGLLTLLVAFVLVMQILDPNEILKDRLVQVVGIAAYLSAFIVTVPAFTSRWQDAATD